jgi:hypothetical protein
VGAATLGLAFAVASGRFAGDARRLALGRIQAARTSGSILGAPILTALAAATLWRGAYVLVLAAYLLAALLVVRGLGRDARGAGRFTVRTVLAAYRPLARDRPMLLLYAASVMRAVGWLGPFVYLGAFYADELGLSLGQIGPAYMLASGGMFCGNLAVGQWLGRVDLRRAFAATTVVMALAWAAIFALPLAAPLVVVAATVASGAAGIDWISLTTLLAAESPAGPGTTMTLNASVFGLGSAVGTGGGGALSVGAATSYWASPCRVACWRPRCWSGGRAWQRSRPWPGAERCIRYVRPPVHERRAAPAVRVEWPPHQLATCCRSVLAAAPGNGRGPGRGLGSGRTAEGSSARLAPLLPDRPTARPPDSVSGSASRSPATRARAARTSAPCRSRSSAARRTRSRPDT